METKTVIQGMAMVWSTCIIYSAVMRLASSPDRSRRALRVNRILHKLRKMPSVLISQDLKESNRPEGEIEAKLRSLLEGGARELCIVSDFDRTITKAASVSTHGVLEAFEVLDEDYRKAASGISNKYFPIEIDPKMTIEEKIPHMKRWYQLNHDLLAGQALYRHMVGDAVDRSRIELRDGCTALLRKAQSLSIPLLVFSAGLGDVIYEALSQKFGRLASTTQVVSNCIIWDEHERIKTFNDPIIHMFNKNQSQVRPDSQPNRSHALLLGDSVGDATMCDGAVAPPKTIVKVGFVNTSVDENLARYARLFDILIVNDGPMDAVNFIFDEIINEG